MKYWPLIRAWLWRRPARTLLAFAAVMMAFTLYGLALGEAEGFAAAAATRRVNIGQGFLIGAMAVSGIGMVLILFLTANAMAQSVRLRLGEFAVLKAIGYSHRLILSLVAAEAALPCLAGAVAGLAAARLLFIVMVALLPPLAMFPPPVYTPVLLGSAALLVLLIGGVSGIWPAARITRLDVAAALAGGLRATAPSRHGSGSTQRQRAAASAAPAAESGLRHIIKTDMHPLRQIVAVTRVGLSTLRYRIKGALAVVISLAIVTLAMGPGLIVADAMRQGLAEEGHPDRAVILSVGARWDFDSRIPAAWIAAIKTAPGIARDAQGAPLADAQFDIHCLGGLRNPRKGGGLCVSLIGMEPAGRAMRSDIRLIAGRWPRPGQRELMVGVRATQVYDQLATGKRLRVAGDWGWGAKDIVSDDWSVVGAFSTNNSFFDADAIAAAGMLRAAARLNDASAIVVQLASQDVFDRFRASIMTNPTLHVSVERQTDYYRRLGWSLPRAAVILEMIVGTLLGGGAMAGIIHMMMIAVEAREGEIAVLRAIGFRAGAAAASVVLEAIMLALAGALLGIAILWVWLDGYQIGGVLPLSITVPLAAQAIAWAWGIAILGALAPARRAANLRLTEALRR